MPWIRKKRLDAYKATIRELQNELDNARLIADVQEKALIQRDQTLVEAQATIVEQSEAIAVARRALLQIRSDFKVPRLSHSDITAIMNISVEVYSLLFRLAKWHQAVEKTTEREANESERHEQTPNGAGKHGERFGPIEDALFTDSGADQQL